MQCANLPLRTGQSFPGVCNHKELFIEPSKSASLLECKQTFFSFPLPVKLWNESLKERTGGTLAQRSRHQHAARGVSYIPRSAFMPWMNIRPVRKLTAANSVNPHNLQSKSRKLIVIKSKQSTVWFWFEKNLTGKKLLSGRICQGSDRILCFMGFLCFKS